MSEAHRLTRSVILASLVAASMGFGSPARGDNDPGTRLRHVRVQARRPNQLIRQLTSEGFDVLLGSSGSDAVDLIVSREELRLLARKGLKPQVIRVGRPLIELMGDEGEDGLPGGYPDLQEIYDAMQATAMAHPAICQFVDLTDLYGLPPTAEGRHLYAMKISDNVGVEEDEPAFLMVSDHHAREIVTPVLGLENIRRLTDGYGNDQRVTDAVDGNEIWIAPVWNPDGYNFVFTGDNLWRKNRRPLGGGNFGVDLNRNYDFGWSSGCSGSSSRSSQTYKGPSPGSEPETETMVVFSEDQRFAKVIDFHSYGRETLWGYACHDHPFESYMRQEAVNISNAGGYGGNQRSPSAEGEHFEWQTARMAAHAFLMETHSEFQPSYQSALNEAAALWPATLFVLERPVPLSGHVTDATTGLPVEAAIELLGVAFQNGETNSSGAGFGRYHSFVPAGNYTVRFSAPGYVDSVEAVSVSNGNATVREVELSPVAQPAVLADVTRTFGLYVSGGLAELQDSDDSYYVLQSGPGFDPSEPHPARADFGFDTQGFAAATVDLTFEEKANIGGPIAVLLIRNWTSSQWDELGRFGVSPVDQMFSVAGVVAADYIDGSNRLEVRLRSFAVLVLNPTIRGVFSHDFVGVQMRE